MDGQKLASGVAVDGQESSVKLGNELRVLSGGAQYTEATVVASWLQKTKETKRAREQLGCTTLRDAFNPG
ncbi:hypothetical protein C6341_g19529 [Phytophthora cactorum]|nr:hypothetical protein C6341_g19529 [Phytophthora cactorum]